MRPLNIHLAQGARGKQHGSVETVGMLQGLVMRGLRAEQCAAIRKSCHARPATRGEDIDR